LLNDHKLFAKIQKFGGKNSILRFEVSCTTVALVSQNDAKSMMLHQVIIMKLTVTTVDHVIYSLALSGLVPTSNCKLTIFIHRN